MDQQATLRKLVSTSRDANPAVYEKFFGLIEESKKSFDHSKVVQVGDKIPSFRLLGATGSEVASDDLLQSGALLLTFYRGEWCPYCNVAVQYLQRHLEEFKSRGVSLVAITPESPDYTLSMTEKHDLKFPVLTDLHNKLARQLGIVYDQSWVRDFHVQKGVDLNVRNGEDTWEVPVPATILVDRSGTVRNVYIEVDYRERLDPEVALEWIDKMNRQ